MIHKALGNEETELSSDDILSKYKDMIREQDRKLKESDMAKQEADSARQAAELKLSQADALIARLNDENTILRAQVNSSLLFCLIFFKINFNNVLILWLSKEAQKK